MTAKSTEIPRVPFDLDTLLALTLASAGGLVLISSTVSFNSHSTFQEILSGHYCYRLTDEETEARRLYRS